MVKPLERNLPVISHIIKLINKEYELGNSNDIFDRVCSIIHQNLLGKESYSVDDAIKIKMVITYVSKKKCKEPGDFGNFVKGLSSDILNILTAYGNAWNPDKEFTEVVEFLFNNPNYFDSFDPQFPKYEEGEPVLYQNGDRFELGIVKRVCGDDEYFINYHTGDTAARTHAENLHKIANKYAFHVIRLDPDDNERR